MERRVIPSLESTYLPILPDMHFWNDNKTNYAYQKTLLNDAPTLSRAYTAGL